MAVSGHSSWGTVWVRRLALRAGPYSAGSAAAAEQCPQESPNDEYLHLRLCHAQRLHADLRLDDISRHRFRTSRDPVESYDP